MRMFTFMDKNSPPEISGKFAFYMEQTFGISHEMLPEIIMSLYKQNPDKMERKMFDDWLIQFKKNEKL